MTTLGDILGSAKRSTAAFQKWAEATDPALAEEVKATAAKSGESFTAFVRTTVADFSRFADEQAWVQLSRTVRDSDDPGIACLRAMVHWRIQVVAPSGVHEDRS